jgi:hypothetical protein
LPPARYNFYVPTPFFHLSIAQDLLQHPTLSAPVRDFLLCQQCEFLLGNTAPDVQVISRQRRTDTHFFDLPIRPSDTQPWERLIALRPTLGQPEQLSPAQAAFIAGYLCHLRADWDWVLEIFIPVFGPNNTWGTFRQRLYYHNVLRAYMDKRLLPGLRGHMESCLGSVDPDGWVPFISSRHLRAWRDLLTPQFHPGAAEQTVEVFASRQGIPSAEYYALLDSETRMQAEIFTHIPQQQIQSYRQRLLVESARLVEKYLYSAVRQASPAIVSRSTSATSSVQRAKENQL